MTARDAVEVAWLTMMVLRLRARSGALSAEEAARVLDVVDFTCFHGPNPGSTFPPDVIRAAFRELVERHGPEYESVAATVESKLRE